MYLRSERPTLTRALRRIGRPMRIGGLERAEVVGLANLNLSDFFSSPREFKLTCNELMDAEWPDACLDGARWALTA
jgi:hypothetical protein